MSPFVPLIAFLRLPVVLMRLARLLLHLAYGVCLAIVYPRFSVAMQRRILQRWSAGLLAVLNIQLVFAAREEAHQLHAGLVVCNHISWLDVFVLNAFIPMRFVAKAEVRRWPLVGWLCVRAQTLFIERGRIRSTSRINAQLSALLQRGESLAVFPEGTTTDGTTVAHFHGASFQPAIDACCPVLPIALRYQDGRGVQSDAANYIGDTTLVASIWRILNAPGLHACLFVTPLLDARSMQRRELAARAQKQICTALEAMYLAALLPKRNYRPVQAARCSRVEREQNFRSRYSLLLYITLSCQRR